LVVDKKLKYDFNGGEEREELGLCVVELTSLVLAFWEEEEGGVFGRDEPDTFLNVV
jgi:hypothetical protein